MLNTAARWRNVDRYGRDLIAALVQTEVDCSRRDLPVEVPSHKQVSHALQPAPPLHLVHRQPLAVSICTRAEYCTGEC